MTQDEAVETFCEHLRTGGYVVRGLTKDGDDVVIEFRKPTGHWSGYLHITPEGKVVEGNGKPGSGAYYTPTIIEPAAGTGAFLSNPPYGPATVPINTWLVEELCDGVNEFWCASDGDHNAIGFGSESEAVAAVERQQHPATTPDEG